MAPLLLRPVEKLSVLLENCQCCRKLSKLSTGGGGGDLKCCPEKFLVCRKIFSVCLKSTALGPPPQKKHGSHAATERDVTHIANITKFSAFLLF